MAQLVLVIEVGNEAVKGAEGIAERLHSLGTQGTEILTEKAVDFLMKGQGTLFPQLGEIELLVLSCALLADQAGLLQIAQGNGQAGQTDAAQRRQLAEGNALVGF